MPRAGTKEAELRDREAIRYVAEALALADDKTSAASDEYMEVAETALKAVLSWSHKDMFERILNSPDGRSKALEFADWLYQRCNAERADRIIEAVEVLYTEREDLLAETARSWVITGMPRLSQRPVKPPS